VQNLFFPLPILLVLSLLPPRPERAPAAREEPVAVGFDLLAGFDWVEGRELPAEIRALNGRRVKITGFMRNEEEREHMTWFWIVNQNCDCQGAPRMNEWVYGTMPEEEDISYTDEPVEVTGVLDVGEERNGDRVVSIYRLAIEEVR